MTLMASIDSHTHGTAMEKREKLCAKIVSKMRNQTKKSIQWLELDKNEKHSGAAETRMNSQHVCSNLVLATTVDLKQESRATNNIGFPNDLLHCRKLTSVVAVQSVPS